MRRAGWGGERRGEERRGAVPVRPSTLVTFTSLTGTFPESILAAGLSQDVQVLIMVICVWKISRTVAVACCVASAVAGNSRKFVGCGYPCQDARILIGLRECENCRASSEKPREFFFSAGKHQHWMCDSLGLPLIECTR